LLVEAESRQHQQTNDWHQRTAAAACWVFIVITRQLSVSTSMQLVSWRNCWFCAWTYLAKSAGSLEHGCLFEQKQVEVSLLTQLQLSLVLSKQCM